RYKRSSADPLFTISLLSMGCLASKWCAHYSYGCLQVETNSTGQLGQTKTFSLLQLLADGTYEEYSSALPFLESGEACADRLNRKSKQIPRTELQSGDEAQAAFNCFSCCTKFRAYSSH